MMRYLRKSANVNTFRTLWRFNVICVSNIYWLHLLNTSFRRPENRLQYTFSSVFCSGLLLEIPFCSVHLPNTSNLDGKMRCLHFTCVYYVIDTTVLLKIRFTSLQFFLPLVWRDHPLTRRRIVCDKSKYLWIKCITSNTIIYTQQSTHSHTDKEVDIWWKWRGSTQQMRNDMARKLVRCYSCELTKPQPPCSKAANPKIKWQNENILLMSKWLWRPNCRRMLCIYTEKSNSLWPKNQHPKRKHVNES